MRVRVTKADILDNWYKVGEEYDVESESVRNEFGDFHPLTTNRNIGIEVGHFEVIEDAAQEPKPIDVHYSFVYTLTESDKDAGNIKLDPYFVSKQWNLGAKDPSGAIWHIFKTCARFGMKNDKAREIKAIYASIKRLAELEGVDLES